MNERRLSFISSLRPRHAEERVFNLRQQFDYEGTAGRFLSSSYAPLEGHPNYAPMMQELQRIFRAHAIDNVRVRIQDASVLRAFVIGNL